MGLGPPVCQHCKVFAYLEDGKGWHCRYCGETNIKDFHPFLNPDVKYLEDNEKLLKFIKGENKNDVD
jgi:hypothetical protein